jgi:hypothetical protein
MPFVLLGMFVVFLLSTGAHGMDQSVLVLVVMCLAVLFLAIRKELKKRRTRLPIGIGVDEESIYIDRSLWSYGRVVTHDKPPTDRAHGVAVPTTLENLHELLHELCSHAGMEFWIPDERSSRAAWLDASAAALLEYTEMYERRRCWDLLLWR